MAGQPDAQTVINLDFETASRPSSHSPAPSQLTNHGVDNPQAGTTHEQEHSPSIGEGGEGQGTPPQSLSAARVIAASFTPMRKGKTHVLDDSPSNRQNESARRARAQEDMAARGRAVDAMRADRLKKSAPRKQPAGGDVERPSGIPVWGGATTKYGLTRTVQGTRDPFDRALAASNNMRTAAQAQKPTSTGLQDGQTPRPLVMAPRPSSGLQGRIRAIQRNASPPPVAGPSSHRNAQAPASTRSEPWRPLTQYLPYQRQDGLSDDDANFPRLPQSVGPHRGGGPPAAAGKGKGKAPATSRRTPSPPTRLEPGSDDEQAARAEALNEAAARRIQDQLWAEEREYNRSRRSQSHASVDDPMDEDVFADEDEEVDILASDSEEADAAAAGYDSFDEISDGDSPDDKEAPSAPINIEPALGDDKAKAAARSSVFADTKARIRWSTPTHEPIAGMTQAKMVAGIDPVQLEQHIRAAYCLDDVYIGLVHAVGGTRAAEIDRVTLVTALDTMIELTCKSGTAVLFSAARQDQGGPSLRPGTVLIETHDEDLGALWQESAHWAMAGVRITIQKYHQPNSVFMVTLEGTRRNSQSVAHGVRSAAKKLTPLKSVFRQYNAIHPGLGKMARDNLIKSVVARLMTLTLRKALGFGTVQYNVFARLNERDPDAEPGRLTGDAEVDGFPPLSPEMHWAVRDAFQRVTIVDGRLGDATPVDVPWDCNLCFAEDHPVGKCHLKDVEGWFKTYEEFLVANTPADRQDKKPDANMGRTRAGPQRGGRGGGRGRGGGSRGGPAKSAPPRRTGGV